ncbi:MAG: Rid family hydrolase [Rubripirellula sp.]|nr:Rid family hydrolase [Rubripirellula sp.]
MSPLTLFYRCTLLLLIAQSVAAADPKSKIQRYGDSLTNSVVTVNGRDLAHTHQLLPAERGLQATEQIEDVFQQLKNVINDSGSSVDDLIQVNLYVASPEVAVAAHGHLTHWIPANARPAVTTVETPLPQDASFGMDAIYAVRQSEQLSKISKAPHSAQPPNSSLPKSQIRILPQGDVVYVSGQAKPGNLAMATRVTLEGLQQTLDHLKLRRTDIVRVKCFLQPMSEVEVVNLELTRFFAIDALPAISHVEWIGGDSRPIEIELVVAASALKTSATISYETPPGMKASPVFSRVARIHGNHRIYVSALISDSAGEGTEQVQSIFEQLIRRLKPARSNLRHLAKAEYYVTSASSSSALNQIRPLYYDPARPPAASKAMVRGIGHADRAVSIAMIGSIEERPVSVLQPLAKELHPNQKLLYKTVGQQKLYLHTFEPPGYQTSDRRAVFLAIHGGGWTGGRTEDFYPIAANFAAQGMLGISLEYRLANADRGTTVFDCVQDARSAVRWIRQNADRLGIDPTKIVVMGGSAGGHLALSTALFEEINDANDNLAVSATPNCLLMMYPVIDTSANGYGQSKIGNRWRQLSPLHRVRADMPPALFFHGTADSVTPFQGMQMFQKQSLDAGNPSKLIIHPGGRHGYIIFNRAEYDSALEQMRQFMIEQAMIVKR